MLMPHHPARRMTVHYQWPVSFSSPRSVVPGSIVQTPILNLASTPLPSPVRFTASVSDPFEQ